MSAVFAVDEQPIDVRRRQNLCDLGGSRLLPDAVLQFARLDAVLEFVVQIIFNHWHEKIASRKIFYSVQQSSVDFNYQNGEFIKATA